MVYPFGSVRDIWDVNRCAEKGVISCVVPTRICLVLGIRINEPEGNEYFMPTTPFLDKNGLHRCDEPAYSITENYIQYIKLMYQ